LTLPLSKKITSARFLHCKSWDIILHNEVVILHIPAARFEGNDEDSDII